MMVMLPRRRLLDNRRDDRGPIFHANLRTERSWRKHVMRHACLRRSKQDYLEGILTPQIHLTKSKL